MHTIIIWDEVCERMRVMERNLQNAMRQEKIVAQIQLNIEPPIIARNNLFGKTPVVQVDNGDYWSIEPNKIISEKNFKDLLILLRNCQIIQ